MHMDPTDSPHRKGRRSEPDPPPPASLWSRSLHRQSVRSATQDDTAVYMGDMNGEVYRYDMGAQKLTTLRCLPRPGPRLAAGEDGARGRGPRRDHVLGRSITPQSPDRGVGAGSFFFRSVGGGGGPPRPPLNRGLPPLGPR